MYVYFTCIFIPPTFVIYIYTHPVREVMVAKRRHAVTLGPTQIDPPSWLH